MLLNIGHLHTYSLYCSISFIFFPIPWHMCSLVHRKTTHIKMPTLVCCVQKIKLKSDSFRSQIFLFFIYLFFQWETTFFIINNQIHIYDFTEQFLHELHKGITCGILRVGLNLSKQPPKLIWEPIDTGRSLNSTCFLMIMVKYKKFIQFHFYIH